MWCLLYRASITCINTSLTQWISKLTFFIWHPHTFYSRVIYNTFLYQINKLKLMIVIIQLQTLSVCQITWLLTPSEQY